MKKLDFFVLLIFIVKIVFIFLSIISIYEKVKGNTNTPIDKEILYWKDRIEFIFICMMSILIIYLFNPMNKTPVVLEKETKLLLFLFGIILLVTAQWKLFIKESWWFKKLQYSV